MVWVTPPTFVAGNPLTAAQQNILSGDLNAIAAAWTAWTPAWTGATTNPVIGNGTITGGYLQIGKMVHFWAKIVCGSTTTYGSGGYQLTLPVAWNASGVLPIASMRYKSAGGSFFTGIPFAVISGVNVSVGTQNGAAFVQASPTVPFTFSSGATIEYSGTYEAA